MDKRTALDGHAAPGSIRNSTASSMHVRLLALATIVLLMVLLIWAMRASVLAQGTATVTGSVVNEKGDPVAGATVRIQATTNSTLSAPDGTFTLGGLMDTVTVTVSAWKHTYYCAKVEEIVPPDSGITLTLRRYQTDDNPQYEWILPFHSDPEVDTCASCKPGVTQIWLQNAHAGAGANARFFSMYRGTAVDGDAGVPPGYLQDFPGTTGNCATCHAPGAGLDTPFSTDMNDLTGADTFGVHCDFCHKVAAVYLCQHQRGRQRDGPTHLVFHDTSCMKGSGERPRPARWSVLFGDLFVAIPRKRGQFLPSS